MLSVAAAPYPDAFNRTIWTFWHQGYDQAPAPVKACLESWRRLNPDWRIGALDGQKLRQVVNFDRIIDPGRKDVTVQKVAAIGRLCLLRRYGGVWTDATVYCLRPLDDWLPQRLAGGYCAFRNPGPDRLSSNWFMASQPDDPILEALHDAFAGMWKRVRFTNQDTNFGKWLLAKLSPVLNTTPERSIVWTNPLLQHLLRVYPYFIFHYTFNRLILRNAALRRQWESAEPLDAGPPHRAQALAKSPGGLQQLIAELDTAGWPLQKLDWRIDVSSDYWSGALGAFLRFTTPSSQDRSP